MNLIESLRTAIGAAEGAISALGPRPSGDVPGLRALAAKLRGDAADAAAAGRLQRGIAESVDYEGPAADRFAANAGDVTESLFVAQRMLDDAADEVERAATRIDNAQRDHDRARDRLLDQISDLGRQLGRALP